jgi:hypothetical protein
MSMDKGGTGYQYLVDDDFPKDITVLEAVSEIQDENFKRIESNNGIYNHHNIFVDQKKAIGATYGCETPRPGIRVPLTSFMGGAAQASGIHYSPRKGNVKTGYYLSKDRKVMIMVDVVNYHNEEKIVYTSSEIEYVPGKPEDYLDAAQRLIDPGDCGGVRGANVHPPKGVKKFSVNGTGIVVARDGYIFNMSTLQTLHLPYDIALTVK